MKKLLVIACLLIVIITSFSLVLLVFNKKYQSYFAAYPFFRNFFGLHSYGDGKSAYLSNHFDTIVLEVDTMQGLSIPHTSLSLLSEKIEAVTGKKVKVVNSDEFPYQDRVTDDAIKELAEKYNNVNFVPNSAKLYLLYLSEYENNVDLLGSTYKEYGILMFDSALKNFTADSPKTFENYVESTALHEFGHQIGLEHNSQADCLMAEHADTNHVAREEAADVIVDFCDYEKKLINLNRN